MTTKLIGPSGLAYLPYQADGIRFAMGRDDSLIADDMGLGKTVQAIGVCNQSPTANSILIICPKSLKANWVNEWNKWDVKGLDVSYNTNAKKLPDTQVVVLNYDVVKKFRKDIDARHWDVLIVDECHYIKSQKSTRTKALLGHGKDPGVEADRRIFLSGTPIMNRPEELWTLCRALDRDGLGRNWRRFHEDYCNAYQDRWGWNTKGASNLEELSERLRSSFMVRRLKKDVLMDLPSKTRQIIALPPNGNGKLVDAEWIAYRNQEEVKAELSQAVQRAGTDESYQSRVDELKMAFRIAFTETAKARKAVALAKVPHVIEHVRNALDQGSVVLFAHHLEVIDNFRNAFDDVPHGVITGDVSTNLRQEIVEEFQAGNLKLIIAGLRAASEGITLTKSSHVIFAELDWTPAKMTQAEDRVHRIGQVNPVLVQHLVMDASLDANIADKLIEKQIIADRALNVAEAA